MTMSHALLKHDNLRKDYELTSPIEDRIAVSRGIKTNKYSAIVQDLKDCSYDVKFIPIEVSTHEFLTKENRESAKMIVKLSRDGTNFRKVCKNISKIAVIASYFIFLNCEVREWTKPAALIIF